MDQTLLVEINPVMTAATAKLLLPNGVAGDDDLAARRVNYLPDHSLKVAVAVGLLVDGVSGAKG